MQEIIGLRTKHAKHFDTGQVWVDESGIPHKVYQMTYRKGQHYKDSDGDWESVETDWEIEAGFGLKVKKASHNLRVVGKSLRFGFYKGAFADFDYPKVLNTKFSGYEAIIEDMWVGTDVRLVATPEGVKEDLVLKNLSHPKSFQIGVRLTGCISNLEDNQLLFYAGEKCLGLVPKPYMLDSSGAIGDVRMDYDGEVLTLTPSIIPGFGGIPRIP